MPETNHFVVVVAPQAEADFDDLIDELLEKAGYVIAEKIASHIQERIQSLCVFPERYPVCAISPTLRRSQCKKWHIYYRVCDQIEIVRILYQSQSVTAVMLEH